VPRDEIVVSIDKDPPKKKSDEDVIDLSLLDAGTDFTQIDTGVTSGADPTSWDPIDVDEKGKVDTCYGEGSGQASSEGSAPACGNKQK